MQAFLFPREQTTDMPVLFASTSRRLSANPAALQRRHAHDCDDRVDPGARFLFVEMLEKAHRVLLHRLFVGGQSMERRIAFHCDIRPGFRFPAAARKLSARDESLQRRGNPPRKGAETFYHRGTPISQAGIVFPQ
jgi:hypothetical protein